MSRKPLIMLVGGAAVAAIAVGLVLVLRNNGGDSALKARITGFRAGLVSDARSFHDGGFNQQQLTGFQYAASHMQALKLAEAIASQSPRQYQPNLTELAKGGYTFIIGTSALLAKPEQAVAKQFPKTKFAITDADVTGPPFDGRTSNLEGLTFATQQSSYLAGCLAGLMTKKQGGKQTVGVVGGVKAAAADAYVAGYQAGAKRCNPGIQVLTGYSQSAVDPAKCKTVAQSQIAAGSQVEFVAAGACGLGALGAANRARIWAIAADGTLARTHSARLLATVVKRFDRAVYLAIRKAQAGVFMGGRNLVFDLKSDAVALGDINPKVPASFLKTIASLRAQIVAGKITPPAKL